MMPLQGMGILVASKPVVSRRGHDGLAALAQSMLEEDPVTVTVFVFRSCIANAQRAERRKRQPALEDSEIALADARRDVEVVPRTASITTATPRFFAGSGPAVLPLWLSICPTESGFVAGRTPGMA